MPFGSPLGPDLGSLGGPWRGLWGSLLEPFGGLFFGLGGKTGSKAILEPFGGRSGGPWGTKVTILIRRGVEN